MDRSSAAAERPRTLSIGGATEDLFVRTGSALRPDARSHTLPLPLGAKIRVEQVIETCGGGAANTAVGLARLGCSAHVCGIIGSDQWGERMMATLRREGVDTRCTTVVEGENSSFSIILSADSGERVILYDPGTNAHLHDAVFDRDAAATMNWIYMNHLHERGRVIEDDVVSILRSHPSIGLTWNPGGKQLNDGIADAGNRALLAETDLLVLNKEEVQQFTGCADVGDALRALCAGGAKAACICDGPRGVTASDGRRTWHCPIIDSAQVVDTTGAGDAFGTGATWALLRKRSLPEALRAGTISATGVIGAFGAQTGLLTDIEMQQRLQTIALDVVEVTP